MSSVTYRPDIDGLRAVAVLPVVIFHTSPTLLPGGFLGVDVFFVISGYLISLILFRQQASGTFRFLDFYVRRVRRLFPALIVIFAATLGFGYFALLADEYERLARHAAFAMAFMLNIRLMDEAGYFDLVLYSKPLLHLWSLSIEEQFYVFWPIVLLLFHRMRAGVGWLISLCAITSLAYAIWLGGVNPDAPYYHPLARFWELLAGTAIAYLHQRNGVNWLPPVMERRFMRSTLSVVGLLLLGSALLAFNKNLQHPGLATLWPVLGAASLIAAGPKAIANRLLALRPLVLIGLISYPLYLWHWPILSYLHIMESGYPAQWVLWSGVLLAFALSVLTYRLAEIPARSLVRHRRAGSYLSVTMASLFVVSLAVAADHGLPDRSTLDYVKNYEKEMVREPITDKSCIELFKGGAVPVYCRQHNASARMVALVGDSHAHVLFPGVSELAAKSGYGTLMLANSGCPPLAGAVTGRNATERQLCAQSIETILGAVRGDTRIVSVVIATRGPQYLTGLGFGPVEAHYNYPPITTEPLPAEGSGSNPGKVFAEGLLATALQLHRGGIGVSYMLQVPELGVPAKDCLRRPISLLRHADGCVVKIEDYRGRMQAYRAEIHGLVARAPFLSVIDVESALCSRTVCAGFIDGQLLYADDNHLSVSGSRRVAPLILKVALEGVSIK